MACCCPTADIVHQVTYPRARADRFLFYFWLFLTSTRQTSPCQRSISRKKPMDRHSRRQSGRSCLLRRQHQRETLSIRRDCTVSQNGINRAECCHRNQKCRSEKSICSIRRGRQSARGTWTVNIVFTLGRKECLSEWFSRARQFSIRIGVGIAFNLALAGSLQAACPRARC
jgi:hypothetical protein